MDRALVQRLTDACRAGQPEAVAELIAAGADVNTRLGSGPPRDPKPLLWAIRPAKWTAGHRHVLELLLDAGARPDGGGPEGGLSPLVAAAERGHHGAVALLVARGARVGFYEAVALGDIEVVRAGLATEPGLASTIRADGVGIHGGTGTALQFAALSMLGNDEGSVAERLATVTERLIAAGAPVGAESNRANAGAPPPIARAAAARNVSVLRVLLHHGADPVDALPAALNGSATTVLAVLDDYHLAVDLPGDSKLANSLVDELIRYGKLESARWLIERGAAVDRADRNGWTTLHYAASRGVAPTLVALLVEHGAPVDARDGEGRTPLDIARERGHAALTELLEAHIRTQAGGAG